MIHSRTADKTGAELDQNTRIRNSGVEDDSTKPNLTFLSGALTIFNSNIKNKLPHFSYLI